MIPKISLKRNAYYYLLIIISLGIGLQSVIYKIGIIFLFIQWILSGDFTNKFYRLRKNKYSFLLIGFYFLYLISFLWSQDYNFAFKDLVLKAPLLLFPLIISTTTTINKNQLKNVLLAFCLASIALNLFVFIKAGFNYLETSNINVFYYQELTISMHSAYQSMFTCFSIILLVYLNFRFRVMKTWQTYTLIFIQFTFILLLSSRMQILLIFTLTPVYFIIVNYKKNQLYKGLLIIILIFGYVKLVVSIPSALNYRYNQIVHYMNTIGLDEGDDINPRNKIWLNGVQVIKENIVFGVGAGDVKNSLQMKFKDNIIDTPFANNLIDSTVNALNSDEKRTDYLIKTASDNNVEYHNYVREYAEKVLKRRNIEYQEYIRRKLNYHNQYLQTFGAIGIFGFLILLYLLASPFIISVKRLDYLSISFLFIISASFLTESMLERQAGVSFFAFFYTLLITSNFQSKSF